MFKAAFTHTSSCDNDPPAARGWYPRYAAGDLDNGQAMVTRDAVALAVESGRLQARDPSDPNKILVGPLVADPTAQVGTLGRVAKC